MRGKVLLDRGQLLADEHKNWTVLDLDYFLAAHSHDQFFWSHQFLSKSNSENFMPISKSESKKCSSIEKLFVFLKELHHVLGETGGDEECRMKGWVSTYLILNMVVVVKAEKAVHANI